MKGIDMGAERRLTLRELNRATLARQLLLERAEVPPLEAIERIAGLQAQVPNPPYIGLWSRLGTFQRADLTALMEAKQVVRATMLRATLHLFSTRDFVALRPTLHPVITRMYAAYSGQRGKGLDVPKVVAAAEDFLRGTPRTFIEIRALMEQIAPEHDPIAVSNYARAHLPIVQVPPGGTWGFGGEVRYALPHDYIGQPVVIDGAGDVRGLLKRYLAAFGPASLMDFQAWSGLTRMKEAVEAVKPELVRYQTEEGKELLDLPDQPLPEGDTPAPVRFLPDYDNLILSHEDRRRVIADEHRSKVYLSAGRVRSTVLIDGFVSGAWKIEKGKKSAALLIEPFIPLTDDDRARLIEEGERLLRFVEDKAESIDIRFVEASG
ncbi:MAG: winged helix DNA-binding domain-containing protein [Anaerolineae bacterium]